LLEIEEEDEVAETPQKFYDGFLLEDRWFF
jgi:hypothetical protein